MLATTLVILCQTGKGDFEILGEALSPKKIEAVSISPKAEWLLGASMGTNPRSIYVINRTETAAYPYPMTKLVGVLDDGSAVCVTAERMTRNITPLTYLINRNGVLPLRIHTDYGDGQTWFEAWGVGPNGTVLGEVGEDVPPMKDEVVPPYRGGFAAIWRDGSWTRLTVGHSPDLPLETAGPFPALAQIPLSDGAIGVHNVLTYVSRHRDFYNAAGTPMFGIFRNDRFDLLPIPNGQGVVVPTAATLDGRTVVSQATGLTVIWRDGSPYVKKYPGVGKIWLKSVASDGKLAVGFWTKDHLQTAIAWDEERGVRPLADLLTERKVDVPKGWTLTDAVGVSPDGKTIFGTAVSKEKTRPFRLQLPDPPSTEGGDGNRH